MVKMRIPIREQLGCLVLLASMIGLAVIAVATWLTNHNFVLDVRSTRLTLTASLKAAQLSSNLALMQILVQQAANRLSPQSALNRYYAGNAPVSWSRVEEDYDAIFSGDMKTRVAVQAQIFPYNSSERAIFSRTAVSMLDVVLPMLKPDGQNATLGDSDYGFISELYPKFNIEKIAYNSTVSRYKAHYKGRTIDNTSYLFSGPFRVNGTLSLVSVTLPIINNTSNIETLGWLVLVMDGALITNVVNAIEGLDDSGLTLLFGPDNATNTFPPQYLFDAAVPEEAPENFQVRYLAPPTKRNGVQRHGLYDTALDLPPFDWTRYPAIRTGFTRATGATNNAGSLISTNNEDGDNVAVGYAVVSSPMVDWMVLVEQSHREVWGPIYRLRNVIIACVFGTMGAMLLLTFPVAHFSSQPIRRLRDATRKTVNPQLYDDDDFSSQNDGANESPNGDDLAGKEGFFGQIIHYRRNAKLNRAEKKEAERRRQFRIPSKVKDRKHFIHDELTDLTTTFNEMTDELMMQYEKLEERVAQRTAELEHSKKAAEAANESKTLFIANISHELKTPLNGILGMCAVCMSEDDPIKLRRSLGIIYKSGDLLLNLLTDLLTFSKNQVGQQLSLDEKEFRLRDISSQVLAIFEKQAREGEIKLNVEFEGPYENNLDGAGRPNELRDLGPFGLGRLKDMVLYGDQHRILQVVINLISNSLKFTPQGGSVTLTIRCPGEATMSESRKASLQSRQSSMRNSKTRIRASASEVGSVSVTTPSHYDTANVINVMGDKGTAYSRYMAQERATTPPPGRWLSFEFEVEDTGPGIPEHLHTKIFEPFVQGDLGLSKKFGGTGLGLSICSQLAGLMKGTIGLKSEVGHGSVFTMVIPLKHLSSRADSTASSRNINIETGTPRRSLSMDEPRGRSHDDALSARSIQSATSGPIVAGNTPANAPAGPVSFESDTKPRLVGLSQPFFASPAPLESPNSQVAAMKRVEAEATKRGAKVKVLVAEDNKTNQEVVLRMLKLEDVYDVTVAKDGQEALDRVMESMERQAPYNLIFMDVQMPNLDGLQSTRLIRQSGFSAPIVALTAYAEESNVKECLESGMDFFLSKPIRRPALKHVLKTYCQTIPEEEPDTPPGSIMGKANGAPVNGTPTNGSPQKPAAASSPPTAPFTVAVSTEGRHTDESPAISPLSSPVSR